MAELRALRARLVRTGSALLTLAPALGAALMATGEPTLAQGESLERLFLNQLEEQLAGDLFFRDVALHLVDDRAPLALLTENPPNQRNRTFYLPWMHKLRENVYGRSLRPLGLSRRSSHAVTPVILLANETSLRKYWRTRSPNDDDYAPSTYDAGLEAVVTCESGNAAWLRRQPVLRDLALGLLDACTPPGTEPSDLWYRRGFAGYVSIHVGTRISALDAYRPNRSAVELLFEVLRKKDRREALWLPLERLLSTRSLDQLDPKSRGDDPSERQFFDDECALWLHFFHHAGDGKYRAGAAAYLGRALAGEGGPAALEECFGTRDLALLEREFEDYVFELYERLFVDRVPTDEPRREEQEQPPAVIDLSALVQAPADPEDALGLALWHARHGRLDRAIESLERRVPDLDGDARARFERELVRLRTLRDARDTLFADALQGGERIRLQHPGGRVHDRLVAIENGELHFARDGSEPVRIDAIDSASLALSLGSPSAELGGGWVRSYGFALAGDSRWKRFLRDDGGIARQLELDAPERLPGLVASGRALGALNELGETRTPQTPEEAARTLERIARVMGELEGEQRTRLDAHRGQVSALARRALELRFLQDGVQGALNGKTEALEDGRLRITYDFSDAAQLGDFEAVEGYLKWRIERLRRELPENRFAVEKDVLRGTGFHCLRHRLEFAAPMSISYEFEFEKRKAQQTDVAEVMVGICDDGKGTYLGCYAQGELHVDHKLLKTFDAIGRGEEPTGFGLGRPYAMEIRNDGERASTWREGEQRQETPVLGLTSGHVFLWVALSGMLRFDNVVIEGSPLPRSMRELRDAWVGEQLEALALEDEG